MIYSRRPASDSLIMAFIDIALPSSHRGGELIFSHDGKQKRYILSDTSQFNCSYSAWVNKGLFSCTSETDSLLVLERYFGFHPITIRASAGAPIRAEMHYTGSNSLSSINARKDRPAAQNPTSMGSWQEES
jgi:hypothetical protein